MQPRNDAADVKHPNKNGKVPRDDFIIRIFTCYLLTYVFLRVMILLDKERRDTKDANYFERNDKHS